MVGRTLVIATLAGTLVTVAAPARATTGPGCLRVVNVDPDDVLNVRKEPSGSSMIVDRLHPTQHGIIRLTAPCIPKTRPWAQRWCPITHYSGNDTASGFVKARFVRDRDCP